MTRRGFGTFVAGFLGLFATASAGAAQSKLAKDILDSAAWIASALSSSGYKADFSPASVGEVERFFELNSKEGKAVAGGLLSENLGSRLFALGSYCGEVLRREVGGQWITEDSDPQGEINAALKLKNGVTCWPIQRVMKRFQSAENNLVHWAAELRKA
jgi:hypothetical protein